MKSIIKRFFNKIELFFLVLLHRINPKKYCIVFPKYLKKIGVDIDEDFYQNNLGYISPDIYIDGMGRSKIHIGKNCTISRNVVFLVHDWSISYGFFAISGKQTGTLFLKDIYIGEGCFIGLGTTILPGSKIGNNCIIGAKSVVRGEIPPNSVVCGNPSKVICSVKDFTNKHIEKKDYQIIDNLKL